MVQDQILEQSYNEIIDCIKNCSKESIILEKIVSQFIDGHPLLFSARNKHRIKSLDQLIHELDKQLLIEPKNISYLESIARSLNDANVSAACDRYHHVQELRNFEEAQVDSTVTQRSPGLPLEVKRLVADSIGRKWTELGRQLGVPEARLDVIEDSYRDHSKRIYKVFEHFENITPPAEQKSKLITALRKSKRKDIAEKVSSLLYT